MSRITMTVGVIACGSHLLVLANPYAHSDFDANGLPNHAQASQGQKLQVQTGVQRRPRPHLVKLSVVQCCSGSSLQ